MVIPYCKHIHVFISIFPPRDFCYSLSSFIFCLLLALSLVFVLTFLFFQISNRGLLSLCLPFLPNKLDLFHFWLLFNCGQTTNIFCIRFNNVIKTFKFDDVEFFRFHCESDTACNIWYKLRFLIHTWRNTYWRSSFSHHTNRFILSKYKDCYFTIATCIFFKKISEFFVGTLCLPLTHLD